MSYLNTKLGKLENKIGVAAFQMTMGYIMDKGFEFCSNISDEDIDTVEENGLMTRGFLQMILRTAREICKEYNIWDEVFPYIRKYINLASAPAHEIVLYKEDFRRREDAWDEILHDLDIEESTSEVLKLIVVDIQEILNGVGINEE